MRNGQVSLVPQSQGKFGAFWVNQHTIVAAGVGGTKFFTFDFSTQRWSEFISGVFVNCFLSPDRQYLYYTTGDPEAKLFRARFTDRRLEMITALNGLRRAIDPELGTQINVAPDGAPIFTRDIGTQEIYALDVKWP